MLTHVLKPFLCKYSSDRILFWKGAELGSKSFLNFSSSETSVIPYSLFALKPFLLTTSFGNMPFVRTVQRILFRLSLSIIFRLRSQTCSWLYIKGSVEKQRWTYLILFLYLGISLSKSSRALVTIFGLHQSS